MMMKQIGLRLAMLPLVVMLGFSGAQAADGNGGVSLSGTRLIFDGGQDAASMTVTNSSATDVWLMRFWVSPYDDNAASEAQSIPFAVTPPLYRLDPKGAVQLRVNKLSEALPTDRESVFYLNNLAIPPKKGEKSYLKAVQSGLQFAMNSRIKLFYRPDQISDEAVVAAAPSKLTVAAVGKDVLVKNPTPYFITLVNVMIGDKSAGSDGDTMVAPFGELRFSSSVAHGDLKYSFVDDRGMTIAAQAKTF